MSSSVGPRGGTRINAESLSASGAGGGGLLSVKGQEHGYSTTDAALAAPTLDGMVRVSSVNDPTYWVLRYPPAVLTSTINFNNIAANTYSTIVAMNIPLGLPAGSMWEFDVYGDLEVSVNTTNVNVRAVVSGSGALACTAQFLGTVLGTAVVRGVRIHGHVVVEDSTHARGAMGLYADTGAVNVLSADDTSFPNQSTGVVCTWSAASAITIQIAWTAGPAVTNAFNAYTGRVQQVA